MKPLSSCLIIFSCLVLSSQVSAKVYKWTDAQGQIHYSEQPSATQSNEVVKIKTGHSDPVSYATTSSTSAESSSAAAPTALPTKDPAACESARKNLVLLQNSTNVKVVDDKGQHRYLAGNEWQEKLDEARRVITEQCE